MANKVTDFKALVSMANESKKPCSIYAVEQGFNDLVSSLL